MQILATLSLPTAVNVKLREYLCIYLKKIQKTKIITLCARKVDFKIKKMLIIVIRFVIYTM